MALGAAVKGITIEFEANTTKLGTALKTIDNQTKGLDKNIRAVDRALKFNPGNTELVAQKQKYLGDRIKETGNRLEQLKKAQAQLDDDPAVDKTSQDYMELQREIITTESKLKHFEAEMEKLKNIKFDQVGQKFQDIGGKMESVGKGMTQKVTAPIVGLGAAAIKSYKDVDEGLDAVTKKTGASGKELESMQESVKNLARDIPTDFKTAGDAVGEVNTRFGLTGDALEKLSGKFVKFADLNDTDVTSAIDMTQKSMEAFRIESKDAGKFLDVLNTVGQNTGIGMDELNTALVKNAPALEDMGLSAEESANFIGQLEKSGVDSSKVMSGLGKALAEGAKEGKSLPEVMGEIEESVVGAKTETEGIAAASEIFGKKAGPMIAKAARDGALDFDSLGKSIGDAGGSVDKTFNETLDPIDKFKATLNSAKIAGAEIGASLMTILAPALDKISSTLQKAAKWWEGLSPGMQNFIIKVALVAAAVGPFLVILGKMLSGFGSIIKLLPSIIKGFQLVGVAFKALGAAFKANAIVLGVMAAIAVGILLYKNWDKIKKVLIKIWNSLSKAVSKAFGAIKKAVSGAWNGISKAAEKAWGGVKKAIETVIKAIAAVIRAYVGIYKAVLSAAWSAIKSVATKAWSAISSAASKAWKGIKDAIVKPITAAKDAVANAYDAMKKKVAEKVSAAASWVSDVKDKISGAIGKAKDAVNSGYDAMKKKVGEKVSAAASWVTDVKDKISNAVSGAKNNVNKDFDSMKKKVGEKVSANSSAWSNVKETVSNAIGKAKDKVVDGWNAIKNKLKEGVSLPKSLTNIGSTIEGLIGKAKRAAGKLMSAIKEKLKKAIKLDIKLPKIVWTTKKKGKLSFPWPQISWNKEGAIFRRPTIFNTSNGLQGLGEAGAEAVLPLDRLFTEMNGMFNSMADNIVNGLIQAQRMGATASDGGGDIHLDVYLYPSGPKMQEAIVRAYDRGKKILG